MKSFRVTLITAALLHRWEEEEEGRKGKGKRERKGVKSMTRPQINQYRLWRLIVIQYSDNMTGNNWREGGAASKPEKQSPKQRQLLEDETFFLLEQWNSLSTLGNSLDSFPLDRFSLSQLQIVVRVGFCRAHPSEYCSQRRSCFDWQTSGTGCPNLSLSAGLHFHKEESLNSIPQCCVAISTFWDHLTTYWLMWDRPRSFAPACFCSSLHTSYSRHNTNVGMILDLKFITIFVCNFSTTGCIFHSSVDLNESSLGNLLVWSIQVCVTTTSWRIDISNDLWEIISAHQSGLQNHF